MNTENDSNIFLNDRISYDEVENFTFKLKNNKACGIDNISNEVLKNKDINMCLWSLFSKCFEFSCIPSSWSKAIISPIPKSKDRDPYVPLNYRGISLLCCISKLYSSLLNNRLSRYLNLFSDFHKKKRSCEDHAYVLSTVLRNRVLSGKSTFVSFIDFEKASDWIPRDLLLYKLLSYNVDGHFYNVIKSMYSNTT